jgi:restriction system protein
MGRRRKSSADDVVDLVALLPWWLGVALAGLSYLTLHRIADQPLPVSTQPAQLGAVAVQAMWHALALFGQYLLPALFLIGAVTSAWRRRERKTLVTNAARSDGADAIDGMTWQQFELLVAEGFRLQGYRVVETGGGGPDGGVDLVLHKNGEKYLVQCKQWRAFRVGVEIVRELYGAMAAEGAAGGFVVTSGRFTDAARSFAEGRNVQLVDGSRLRELLTQAQAPKARPPADIAPSIEASSATSPACPVCAKPMLRRTARRGAQVGSDFWGCSGYPSCKGTRQIG